VGAVVTLVMAACSSSGGSAAPANTPSAASSTASSSPSAASVTLGAGSLPAQAMQTLPAFPSFYDAHKDVVVVTDAFPRSAASRFHANYAPSLSVVKPASQPAWYIVQGRAAPGQIVVLGSEPGESDYSPLWKTVLVTWKAGVTPKLLTSDNMILSLAKAGDLTTTTTSLLVNAPVTSVKGKP
jgi:hypothetical protein